MDFSQSKYITDEVIKTCAPLPVVPYVSAKMIATMDGRTVLSVTLDGHLDEYDNPVPYEKVAICVSEDRHNVYPDGLFGTIDVNGDDGIFVHDFNDWASKLTQGKEYYLYAYPISALGVVNPYRKGARGVTMFCCGMPDDMVSVDLLVDASLLKNGETADVVIDQSGLQGNNTRLVYTVDNYKTEISAPIPNWLSTIKISFEKCPDNVAEFMWNSFDISSIVPGAQMEVPLAYFTAFLRVTKTYGTIAYICSKDVIQDVARNTGSQVNFPISRKGAYDVVEIDPSSGAHTVHRNVYVFDDRDYLKTVEETV